MIYPDHVIISLWMLTVWLLERVRNKQVENKTFPLVLRYSALRGEVSPVELVFCAHSCSIGWRKLSCRILKLSKCFGCCFAVFFAPVKWLKWQSDGCKLNQCSLCINESFQSYVLFIWKLIKASYFERTRIGKTCICTQIYDSNLFTLFKQSLIGIQR